MYLLVLYMKNNINPYIHELFDTDPNLANSSYALNML